MRRFFLKPKAIKQVITKGYLFLKAILGLTFYPHARNLSKITHVSELSVWWEDNMVKQTNSTPHDAAFKGFMSKVDNARDF